MINFIWHGATCAFWCFIWHQFHHWWAHKHAAHYEPKPKPKLETSSDPDLTLGCICFPGETDFFSSPDPMCQSRIHRA